MVTPFRHYVPESSHEICKRIQGLDAYQHADALLEHPVVGPVLRAWSSLTQAPFRGISNDGRHRDGLFTLRAEDAPTEAMTTVADRLLQTLTLDERSRISQPLGSKVWRTWSNPEIYVHRNGLRLDETSSIVREAIFKVVEASLSPEGYRKARDCMYMNGFLGELVNAPRILNEYSYNFSLFGAPSLSEPWGWHLYGHHLAMNCLVIGKQMVVSPCFWGAEPNEVDEGPRAGLSLFRDEELGGLDLMQGLPDNLRATARIARGPDDPSLPHGRVHPGDHLHLAGAYQDNRIIPLEGACAGSMKTGDRQKLLKLVETYHRHLPGGVRAARLADIERHLDHTHFCWVGGYDEHSPFYYRIQSPVVIIEFDHHAGVFLTNTQAEKFHIHTLIRTPNGNDYGMALVKAQCEAHHRSAIDLTL